MNPGSSVNSTFISYAVCRCTVAFVWFYHGLVPKLLYPHRDELAMSMALGFSSSGAEKMAIIGGVAEIAMSGAVLLFWRQRWPLLLTVAAMFGLLGFVILFKPVLLGGAFNPVTTNITVIALALVGLHLQRSMYGGSLKYFAYGSNMSLPRLKERVPSAERLGVYTLAEHSLRFHKVSKEDRSAKCDALFTGNPGDRVIGALFEIPVNQKKALDRAEALGYGYEEKRVLVNDAQGRTLEAFTYYATNTDPALLPYSWYLNHVIYGAKETEVPASYLAGIEVTKSKEDPNKKRDARERAIYR
jgi:hypothetical protein